MKMSGVGHTVNPPKIHFVYKRNKEGKKSLNGAV
jgi:hypothetical protein